MLPTSAAPNVFLPRSRTTRSRAPADHRHDRAGRLLEARLHQVVVVVHRRVRAQLELRDPGVGARPEGRRRPGRGQDRARDAVRLEVIGHLDEVAHRGGLLLVALLGVHLERAVALVAGEAVHPQAGQRLDACGRRPAPPRASRRRQRCIPVSTSTSTPIVLPASDRGGGERLGVVGVVDLDDAGRLAGEERGRASLLRVHELVGDEDVVRAGADHDDRLPDRGRAQPEGAVLQLQPARCAGSCGSSRGRAGARAAPAAATP